MCMKFIDKKKEWGKNYMKSLMARRKGLPHTGLFAPLFELYWSTDDRAMRARLKFQFEVLYARFENDVNEALKQFKEKCNGNNCNDSGCDCDCSGDAENRAGIETAEEI